MIQFVSDSVHRRRRHRRRRGHRRCRRRRGCSRRCQRRRQPTPPGQKVVVFKLHFSSDFKFNFKFDSDLEDKSN